MVIPVSQQHKGVAVAAAHSSAIQNHAEFIWSVADRLRDDYEHSEYGTNVRPQLHRVNGGEVCRTQVDPSGFKVDATVIHDKNGQHVTQTQFFVPVANGTNALADEEKQTYLSERWPGAA
jgi:hypothetical protein